MNNRIRQILLHLVGCMIFLTLPILFKPGPNDPRNMFIDFRFASDLVIYILLIGFYYLNYYTLVPEYYFKRKYVLYTVLIIVFYLVLISIPDLFLHPPDRGPLEGDGAFMADNRPPPHENFFLHKIGNNLFLFMIVLFFSLMIRISSQWKKTEEEKVSAELSYLKAQINPHFLFNTLNSIYSLAIQKSDDTATAVVKLSGMMRYVISEAHKDFVPLEKEITYLRSYIELQQLRFGTSIGLRFQIKGSTGNRRIAPLLLIPFIENAFKYGVNAEENSDIAIEIRIAESTLYLSVKNKKVFIRPSEDNKSGLGINNTRNRLRLLYPEQHELSILDGDDYFSVTLNLKL